jgi:hypothetical protein
LFFNLMATRDDQAPKQRRFQFVQPRHAKNHSCPYRCRFDLPARSIDHVLWIDLISLNVHSSRNQWECEEEVTLMVLAFLWYWRLMGASIFSFKRKTKSRKVLKINSNDIRCQLLKFRHFLHFKLLPALWDAVLKTISCQFTLLRYGNQ